MTLQQRIGYKLNICNGKYVKVNKYDSDSTKPNCKYNIVYTVRIKKNRLQKSSVNKHFSLYEWVFTVVVATF